MEDLKVTANGYDFKPAQAAINSMNLGASYNAQVLKC